MIDKKMNLENAWEESVIMNLEARVKWVERTDRKKDPLDFFREHYDSSTTRTKLSKEDNALYRILHRRGVLDVAIPDFDAEASENGRRARIEVSRFGQNPLEFYRENYPGMTRGQLGKEDQGLYQRLRGDGLLEEVPLTLKRKQSRLWTNPLEFYRENYPGMTRGQLGKEDQGLYQRLRRDGLLGEVPLKQKIGN